MVESLRFYWKRREFVQSTSSCVYWTEAWQWIDREQHSDPCQPANRRDSTTIQHTTQTHCVKHSQAINK